MVFLTSSLKYQIWRNFTLADKHLIIINITFQILVMISHTRFINIVVGQTVLEMVMKEVGQVISIHDKTLEEVAKTV